MANHSLAIGNRITTGKVNFHAWAKPYGRSKVNKASGLHQSSLGGLASESGGYMEQVCTYSTYLSSRYRFGRRAKKLLSERKHTCGWEFVHEGMNVGRYEFTDFPAPNEA